MGFQDFDHQQFVGLMEMARGFAYEYASDVREMRAVPGEEAIDALHIFDERLPKSGERPEEALAALGSIGSAATAAQTGGRYFGFVNGGAYPPALAARWLADVWDQNAALEVMSPLASRLERTCESWIVQLLGLPESTAMGIVGGTATSLICGVVTARDALLRRKGWDTHELGLRESPRIRVVLGDQAHTAVLRALAVVGIGRSSLERVPVDDQGRMIAEAMPPLDDSTLVLTQAGNVNTGAFDPFEEICHRAREADAWVHVDGAFGLWAVASKATASIAAGLENADSWSVDAHKTLNLPYDSGIILCRDRSALTSSLQADASYLERGEQRDGMFYTLDMSRRARAVELWIVLKTLGREGVDALVSQLCLRARSFAEQLEAQGFRLLNDVVFNQVLVACESSQETEATLRGIQSSGECWCGGTQWESEPAIRVSVCSWVTTEEDVKRSVAAFVAARQAVREGA